MQVSYVTLASRIGIGKNKNMRKEQSYAPCGQIRSPVTHLSLHHGVTYFSRRFTCKVTSSVSSLDAYELHLQLKTFLPYNLVCSTTELERGLSQGNRS